MNPISRLAREYTALAGVLAPSDLAAVVAATIRTSPSILRTGKLTSLDVAMSRDITLQYRGNHIALPLAQIDRYLATCGGDNPTFGNVREMYALDCYMRRLTPPRPLGTVLDLGANRGMFSLLALAAFDAKFVIGVEPSTVYNPIVKVLLGANGIRSDRAHRYNRFISSPTAERRDRSINISVETICREQGIERINFAKIDIEGSEKELFKESAWLERVDALAMELHFDLTGDLSSIPQALDRQGFYHISVGQFDVPCAVNDATFLYASRRGMAL